MEFVQKLTAEDLINLNLHILKQNKKIVINTVVISVIALAAAIYSFVTSKILVGIVFIVVMLAALILIPLSFKSIVKTQVTKNMKKQNNWDILIKIDNEGLYYAFTKENPENVDKYVWGDMYYAIDTKGYIYIQISQMTYLLIKKSASPDELELEKYFIDNLKLNVRYFQKK